MLALFSSFFIQCPIGKTGSELTVWLSSMLLQPLSVRVFNLVLFFIPFGPRSSSLLLRFIFRDGLSGRVRTCWIFYVCGSVCVWWQRVHFAVNIVCVGICCDCIRVLLSIAIAIRYAIIWMDLIRARISLRTHASGFVYVWVCVWIRENFSQWRETERESERDAHGS